MTTIRSALLCALPFALSACAVPHAVAPVTVTLAPGERASIGQGETIIYDSYSDSRCPKGVWCVWSGELAYHFTVVAPNASEAFAITLPNTAHVSPGGARIALDPSRVPPAQTGNTPAQYAVTLTVSRP